MMAIGNPLSRSPASATSHFRAAARRLLPRTWYLDGTPQAGVVTCCGERCRRSRLHSYRRNTGYKAVPCGTAVRGWVEGFEPLEETRLASESPNVVLSAVSV
jgi:hypothetical protein